MKTLRVFPGALKIRRAQMPYVSEFKAVKLTYEQAMAFEANVSTFDEIIARYGASKQLQAGEFYVGYIAVLYPWGRADVVYLNGCVQKILPSEAAGCLDYNKAKIIREGKGWTAVYPCDGKNYPGGFDYVWTFNGCRFAAVVEDMKKAGSLSSDIDAEEMDERLKHKLVSALNGNKIVELTDEEDLLLKAYLGEKSYYEEFFTEIK